MPALHAPVQLANAAAAIAALQALPVEVPAAAWVQGIGNAQVAGRLQRLAVDGLQVLLDVGHNPQAARALAAALGAQAHAGSTYAIYAALADKDVVGVVEAVAAQIDHWALAGLEGARGQSAQALHARLQGLPPRRRCVTATLPAQWRRSWPQPAPATACWCSARFTPWPTRLAHFIQPVEVVEVAPAL